MLDISIQNMVNALVEQELGGSDNVGMHFAFSLQTFVHCNDKEYKTSAAMHLVYHRFRDSNYISVFSHLRMLDRFAPLDFNKLHHEVSHDSCWKNPGTFTRVYFELANIINDQRAADGRDRMAPAHMNHFNHFPLFSNRVFTMLPVKVDRDPNDKNGYRRRIVSF